MPRDTKVGRCYDKLKQKYPKGKAAAICQHSTGLSLKTGKPPKSKVRAATKKNPSGRKK